MCISVDLPEPDGPVMATNSPSSMRQRQVVQRPRPRARRACRPCRRRSSSITGRPAHPPLPPVARAAAGTARAAAEAAAEPAEAAAAGPGAAEPAERGREREHHLLAFLQTRRDLGLTAGGDAGGDGARLGGAAELAARRHGHHRLAVLRRHGPGRYLDDVVLRLGGDRAGDRGARVERLGVGVERDHDRVAGDARARGRDLAHRGHRTRRRRRAAVAACGRTPDRRHRLHRRHRCRPCLPSRRRGRPRPRTAGRRTRRARRVALEVVTVTVALWPTVTRAMSLAPTDEGHRVLALAHDLDVGRRGARRARGARLPRRYRTRRPHRCRCRSRGSTTTGRSRSGYRSSTCRRSRRSPGARRR